MAKSCVKAFQSPSIHKSRFVLYPAYIDYSCRKHDVLQV